MFRQECTLRSCDHTERIKAAGNRQGKGNRQGINLKQMVRSKVKCWSCRNKMKVKQRIGEMSRMRDSSQGMTESFQSKLPPETSQ